ncbi:AAA family ATPase [Campylobacter lari]|nr:AAA family ATPase [Campylobacter lari]
MTAEELGLKLKDMYENAPKGNKVTYIHYFGIKFAEEIRKNSLNEIVKYANISESYATEIAKAISLADVLNQNNTTQYNHNSYKNKENQNIPRLNQILYGPPGTGKTYHTIDKALEILGENLASRYEKKAKFNEYVKKGQIVFTTFHQSYGYEEFVEGIKPEFDEKELKYEVKSGIFKKICDEALNKEVKNNNLEKLEIDNKTSVWKISLGEKSRKDTEFLQKYCFENNQIRIGWGNTKEISNESSINNFKSIKIGDLICVLDTKKTIKAIGVVKSEVKYSKEEEFEKDYGFDLYEYQTYRDVEWILKNKIIDIYKLNRNTELDLNTVYKLKNISPSNLIETIKDHLNDKFIIIIDEINRGNVSKIFGELITLIEPSKRIGADEELKVTLPYSKDEFGVPKNVYIIGTMNTADRSITSLDTALRRRFEFVEMMPKPNVLSDNCEDVNLQKLLEAINTRIEYLLDREKTIGHAFFIGIENLEKLKNVFQNKIIPLLQEYFYNDYALIDAVLNKNGMLKKQDKKNMTDFIESDRVIYKFSDSEDWNENTFKKIYEQ